jgi:hypothetical protein
MAESICSLLQVKFLNCYFLLTKFDAVIFLVK